MRKKLPLKPCLVIRRSHALHAERVYDFYPKRSDSGVIPYRSVVMILVVLFLVGCLAPTRQTAKQAPPLANPPGPTSFGLPTEAPTPVPAPPPDQGLIKAYIPEDESAESGQPSAQTAPPQAAVPPQTLSWAGTAREGSNPPRQSKSDEQKKKGGQWEDQKVTGLALEEAKGIPSVQAGKVCYDTEYDEWSVILYDDTGPILDLKQYIWNRDSERLEPFLVKKEIPPSRLKSHLNQKERGKLCKPLPLKATSQPTRR